MCSVAESIVRPPVHERSWCWNAGTLRATLYRYFLMSDAMVPLVLTCVALGLISAAVGTTFHIILEWETATGRITLTRFFTDANNTVAAITDSFKFFPQFLIIAYR